VSSGSGRGRWLAPSWCHVTRLPSCRSRSAASRMTSSRDFVKFVTAKVIAQLSISCPAICTAGASKASLHSVGPLSLRCCWFESVAVISYPRQTFMYFKVRSHRMRCVRCGKLPHGNATLQFTASGLNKALDKTYLLLSSVISFLSCASDSQDISVLSFLSILASYLLDCFCWRCVLKQLWNDAELSDGRLSIVCVSVCFFVPHARPQFRANLHEIWYAASLYPPDGHGG